MTSLTKPPVPFVLSAGTIDDREAEAVLDGAVVSRADVIPFEVTGPGAVTCLQGLLTNDIEGAGDGACLYAAILSPKGMIISDMWVTRSDGVVWLTPPSQGSDALSEGFTKYLPPRLARATDRSDSLSVIRIVGPTALGVAGKAGLNVPEPGKSSIAIAAETECLVSRPPEGSYYHLQVQLAQTHAPRLERQLSEAGGKIAGVAALDLSRIIHGWPRLGAEIDSRTLPQEVRYDELNGVSYTKGCYTGQETVARLHFRGHANKELRGLLWTDQPDPAEPAILQGDRIVGRVTSIAWLAPVEQFVGLGIVHRKAGTDVELMAAGAPAVLVDLPIPFETLSLG